MAALMESELDSPDARVLLLVEHGIDPFGGLTSPQGESLTTTT